MKADITNEQMYREVQQEIAMARNVLYEWIEQHAHGENDAQFAVNVVESFASLARATAVYEYRQAEQQDTPTVE